LVTHLQHAVVDLAFEIVHRARRRAAYSRTVHTEDGVVAWTNELLLRLDPRDGTTEMRTNRRQHAHRSIFRRQNVNRLFRNDFSPAIALFDRDQLFYRPGDGCELISLADIGPSGLGRFA